MAATAANVGIKKARFKFLRKMKNQVSTDKITTYINFIMLRAIKKHQGWQYKITSIDGPVYKDSMYHYGANLLLSKEITSEKKEEIAERQFNDIVRSMAENCNISKWGENPFILLDHLNQEVKAATEFGGKPEIHGVEAVICENPIRWDEINIPDELLHEDEAIMEHPCFSDIYDLYPQIRTILSAVKDAAESEGKSRNHGVCWGPPGCGKTTVLRAIDKFLGPGAVMWLDATNTTRPGLEKLIFEDLPEIPPLFFMEEIEKANEEALKMWLGALDDRGEIRKVNFRQARIRPIKILFFCTANNKHKFDVMMNSGGQQEAGALSSRCVNEIFFQRPSDTTLKLILQREIRDKGGKEEWIQPCIELAHEMDTTDPRRIRAYLSGKDRLMTGEYQKDRLAIRQKQLLYQQSLKEKPQIDQTIDPSVLAAA